MRKRLSKAQWKRRRMICRSLKLSACMITLIALVISIVYLRNSSKDKMNILTESESNLDGLTLENGVTVKSKFLSENEYSRPGIKLKKVNGIVIHYVANPMTTAQNNRDYFEGLAISHQTYASSHFVVGLKGEIVQCIPLNEVSYCSNNRNEDTISIEVCHPKEDGKFKKVTYKSVVELTAYLCNIYGLSEEDVIRHYDVTGKICPKYYVEHPEAWIKFKKDVKKRITKQKKK